MIEGLLRQAEWVRVEATLGLDSAAQSAQGQYFTPELAAALIADMPNLPEAPVLRVLDPGAGSGMLTAAIVDRVSRDGLAGRIEVTAVECDQSLLPALRRTAELCEQWGRLFEINGEQFVTIIPPDSFFRYVDTGAKQQ